MKKTIWVALLATALYVMTLSSCETSVLPNGDGETQQSVEGTSNNETGDVETEDKGTDAVACEHTFGDWETVKAATCAEEGELVRTCSVCAATEKKIVEKSTQHIVVVDEAVPATCQKKGLTEGSHCAICRAVFVEQETIAKLAHTVVTDEAVEATCSSTGLTEGSHCSVCRTKIVKQNSIALVAHNYEERVCTACGAREPSRGLEFMPNSTGYAVTGIGSCLDEVIVIPSTYQGKPVTEIVSAGLFCEHVVREIVIPDTVRDIQHDAIVVMNFCVIDLGKNAKLEDRAIEAAGGCELINRTSNTLTKSVFTYISSDAPYSICRANNRQTEYTSDGFVFLRDNGQYHLCAYLGNDPELILPENYNGKNYIISTYCFWKVRNISKVVIGNGVTHIGASAFAESSLREIDLTGRVTQLQTALFFGCASLTHIDVPDNIRDIFPQCFDGAGLVTVSIGKSVTQVWNSIFRTCENLDTLYYNAIDCQSVQQSSFEGFKKVVIGKDVEIIPNNFMIKNSALISLTFEEGSKCTTIGSAAFAKTSITSVEIPASVKSINCAFAQCENLTRVCFRAANCTSAQTAFNACGGSQGVDFVIGNGVTRLPASLICNTKIRSLTFEENSTCARIEKGFSDVPVANVTLPISVAFFERVDFAITSLTLAEGNPYHEVVDGCLIRKADHTLVAVLEAEYQIPADVRVIAEDAFYESGVTHIVIPDTVVRMENGCLSCATAVSLSLPFVGNSVDDPTILHTLFPAKSRTGFTTVVWKDHLNIVEATYHIPSDLSEITIRGGNITQYACKNMHMLRTVRLTQGVGSIEAQVFYGTGVEAVYFDGARDEFLAYVCAAFRSNPNADIYFANDAPIRVIDAYIAATGASWILTNDGVLTVCGSGEMPYVNLSTMKGKDLATKLVIQEGITQFKESFYGDSSLAYFPNIAEIEFPSTIVTLNKEYFKRTAWYQVFEAGTEAIYIGDRLVMVPSAISGTFIIREGTVTISQNAFYQCAEITEIQTPLSVTVIEKGAFYGCKKLARLDLHEGITTIEMGAIDQCDSLVEITIPSTVTTLNGAITRCDNLKRIVVSDNAVLILSGGIASYCESLETVVIGTGVTELPINTLYECGSLQYVILRGDVTKVDSSAFWSTPDGRKFLCYSPDVAELLRVKYPDSVYIYSENEPSENGMFWRFSEDGDIEIYEI